MEGIPLIYNGRRVVKENFRAYVYSVDNAKKLVNSWNEFEQAMASGIWFQTIKEIKEIEEAKTKIKRMRKPPIKVEVLELKNDCEEQEEQPGDSIEVNKDDFLPKASS